MDNPTSQREAVLTLGSKAQRSQPSAPKGAGTQHLHRNPGPNLLPVHLLCWGLRLQTLRCAPIPWGHWDQSKTGFGH